MKSILDRFRRRRFVAVDFDSRYLRIVEAERGSPSRIVRLAGIEIPDSLDPDDSEAVGRFVGESLKTLGLAGLGIIMNVPRSQAVLKSLRLPSGTTRADLPGMVQYQVEKELPFRIEEAVIDFTDESRPSAQASPSEGAAGIDVLVAAIRLPVVEHYKQIAFAAGSRLLSLGLRPYSDRKCVEICTAVRSQECMALVHVGPDETEISVMEGGSLIFSRSAGVKTSRPVEADEPAVASVVSDVVTEVARSFQSFSTMEHGRRIDAVLVAGGTGIEARICDELSARLELRCELLNPAGPMGLTDPGASAFTSALGLAIGRCDGGEMPLDFLKPKRPVHRRDAKKVRAVAIAGGAALLVLLAVVFGAVSNSDKQARNEKLQGEFAKLEKENKVVKAMQTRMNALEGWANGARPWLDHWANLGGLFPPCQDAYISALKADGSSISFIVRARSRETIDKLGEEFAKAGYGFNPGAIKSESSPDGYSYSSAVTLIVPVPEKMKIDLSSIRDKQKPRPGDDGSADGPTKKSGRGSGSGSGSKSTSGESGRDQPR